MSDADGSATALVAPDAGTPEAAKSGADPGSTTVAAADPFSGLETGTREWVGTKGYKTIADIAKAAQNAEGLIGRSIVLPDDKAKPEDWEKVYSRLGRPEKPEAYEFKLPEGIPDNFNYDAERAAAFKTVAHKAGLTPKQAAVIHDEEVKANAQAFAKLHEQVETGKKAATEALVKQWGPKDSDGFKQSLGWAVRAIDGLDKIEGVTGLKAALEGAGVLLNGEVMEPSVAIALAHIGKAMFKEDSLELGGAAMGDNPFTGTNNTLQMQAVNADREKAKRLVLAAGKKLEEFGLA